jgi:hypothetical protein
MSKQIQIKTKNIIAHLVGLDDLTKFHLKKVLINNLKFFVVDLDDLQQIVQQNSIIKSSKITWTKISKRINEHKRFGSKNSGRKNQSETLSAMMLDRINVKNKIYYIIKMKIEILY